MGRAALGIALVCWVLSIPLGWVELAAVAAAMALAMLVATVLTAGRVSLDVLLEAAPERVVVGERVGGAVTATNPGGRRRFPQLLEVPVGRASATFSVPSLAAAAEHESLFVVPTERRGVITVGPASAIRADPLGLVRRSHPRGDQSRRVRPSRDGAPGAHRGGAAA